MPVTGSVASSPYGDDPASGAECPLWVCETHHPEPEDIAPDEDFVLYTCTGCGAYGPIRDAEHACAEDPMTGRREVGGSFQ
jgi:hypothetical protein